MSLSHRVRLRAGLSLSVLLVAGLAACGGGSSEGSTSASSSGAAATTSSAAPSVATDPAINAMLPDDIKSAGTIDVATEALYPPYEYLAEDGKTVIGLDPELMTAVTQKMGITYTVTNTAFDGLLPGLESDRYRVVMAAVSDTKARQEKYDFVDYFQAGQAILVAKGNPKKITDVATMCGHPVSVLVSSAQEALLNRFNTEECASNPITITSLPSDNDALLQVQSGRADASFTQEPVGRYNASQIAGGNAFEVANSETLLPNPLGLVFRKDDTQLRDAFQAAYQSIMDDGTYEAVLAARDLQSGGLTTATVNAGTA